jgi:hypothetical protein
VEIYRNGRRLSREKPFPKNRIGHSVQAVRRKSQSARAENLFSFDPQFETLPFA